MTYNVCVHHMTVQASLYVTLCKMRAINPYTYKMCVSVWNRPATCPSRRPVCSCCLSSPRASVLPDDELPERERERDRERETEREERDRERERRERRVERERERERERDLQAHFPLTCIWLCDLLISNLLMLQGCQALHQLLVLLLLFLQCWVHLGQLHLSITGMKRMLMVIAVVESVQLVKWAPFYIQHMQEKKRSSV